MAQNYSELRKDNVRDAIYEDVANNLEVLRTSWAGNAFPENPKVGQACYRIDEDNLYFWDGTTWSQKGGGGIDMNTGDKLYDWVGTLAEYKEQDIENQHPEYLCFITDDETPVVCATRSLDNLDAAGQAKLDEGKKISVVTIPATSGAVTLADNTVYTGTITGEVRFFLPTVTDATQYHQIKAMLYLPAVTINWGTSLFFNKTTPEIEAGNYSVYWDYDPLLGAWVCGVMIEGAGE